MENVVTIDGKRYELRVAEQNEEPCEKCAFVGKNGICTFIGRPIRSNCITCAAEAGMHPMHTYLVRVDD